MQRDVAERPPPAPTDPPSPAEDGQIERPRPSVRSLLLEGLARMSYELGVALALTTAVALGGLWLWRRRAVTGISPQTR